MYHPTRGGVRGGRDQFKWDDVKVDKHRENYLGHSVKAPVGRWQKGKDLLWYTRDKKSDSEDAMKEEIRRVKEEEEQAMREALGLAPKRSSQPKGNRLDKHEYAELIKRGSTAEDMGAGHAEAAQVQGLGLYKGPQNEEEPSSPNLDASEMKPDQIEFSPPRATKHEDSEDDDRKGKRRRGEERREEKGKERRRGEHSGGKERRRERHESNRGSWHDPEDREKRRGKDKQKKRRHDSD
ncbi:multiple myeloma tumor-associated protein 2 homolog [Brachypodium distachyon]|uniref:Multiple myeloma tumor-associated protein 2-like N-terminal domain-containing protein n=1 Tax=Brachypodium distachyon TaxID=15368 RepID=I1I9H1_BRADI|nr:multiple myeloma tumor-associated protein 2 homolog [Brachypodium distachyon]KQJ99365.1 hypothetical protein BRADI_3g42860v3 [Brachypodium distachyon]|eukprot:XP_003574933.1 multiple myeloma tumor-associated protein 2 homolog [Brachypodium distachyon]